MIVRLASKAHLSEIESLEKRFLCREGLDLVLDGRLQIGHYGTFTTLKENLLCQEKTERKVIG